MLKLINYNFMPRVSDTDGYELTATDIQLDNPIEPGSIIAIKRPIKVSFIRYRKTMNIRVRTSYNQN